MNASRMVCDVFQHSPVFERADVLMYEEKKLLKSMGVYLEGRRRNQLSCKASLQGNSREQLAGQLPASLADYEVKHPGFVHVLPRDRAFQDLL